MPAHSNVGRHDFGTINALDIPQVTHDFTLRNDSPAPMIVTRLQTSCGCTTATIEALNNAKAPRPASPSSNGTLPTPITLASGQHAQVHVAVDLAGHAPGMLYKTVLVFVQGRFQPVALLEMQGQLQPAVSFSPSLLDFGKATGSSLPQTITATIDARLVPSGQIPPLLASTPAIRVTPAAVSQTSTRKSLTRTYQITLAPDAPLGPLTGTLTFGQPTGKDALPSTSAAPFMQAAALVVGQVTGDLVAAPALLAFGNVPEGTAKDLSVTLTGTTTQAITGLKVQSDSPWLSARLSDAGATNSLSTGSPASVPARQLTVTIGAQTPHGVQQAQVTVTLASGRRLVLPVTVYVMPPLPAAAAASIRPIVVTH